MSGAIMPDPLAMPAIVTGGAVDVHGRGGALRKGVGGHDRPGRRRSSSRWRGRRRARRARRRSSSCGSGSPITPVDEVKTRSASTPNRAATAAQSASTEARPWRPVKALELPELTRIAAAPPPDPTDLLLAVEDGRRACRGAGEDPGDARSGVEQREHHVGPAGIADAGGGSGEAHAGDRRQMREARPAQGATSLRHPPGGQSRCPGVAAGPTDQRRPRSGRSMSAASGRLGDCCVDDILAQRRGELVAHRLERGRLLSARLVEPDDVPAELRLHRLGDLSRTRARRPLPRTRAPSCPGRTSQARRRSGRWPGRPLPGEIGEVGCRPPARRRSRRPPPRSPRGCERRCIRAGDRPRRSERRRPR